MLRDPVSLKQDISDDASSFEFRLRIGTHERATAAVCCHMLAIPKLMRLGLAWTLLKAAGHIPGQLLRIEKLGGYVH